MTTRYLSIAGWSGERVAERAPGPLRVLMLSRSYPSDVFPNFGLWVERPTILLNEREGYEVRVVSPQPYCPPLPPLGPLHHYSRFRGIPKREVRNGVEIIRPRFAAGPGHTASAFESRAYARAIGRALARLGSRFPFDLIHAHFIYPEGAAAHDLSRRYGVPFVITEHAPWTQERLSKRAVRSESLAAGRAASGLMAVSTYVRTTIERWLGDTVPVAFVPTGVDCELFTPHATRSFDEDRILFVGWPNFNKGVDVLLDAMKLIHDRGQPGRLELVGGSYYRGTRLDEQRLKAYTDSLMLGARVAFVGPRPPAEVARLMARAAVVVLPSRSEASGTVLVEAMACGTPVVATRCGGPEDYVTPDVGRLVPVDDHVALADALVEVMRERARFDPEELRRYALDRFAWPRIVDAWLRAYDRALGTEARWASPDETAVAGSR